MTTVYIIKRGSQSVVAVIDDAPKAQTELNTRREADFKAHRQAYRDLDHYKDTHMWWIEEVKAL